MSGKLTRPPAGRGHVRRASLAAQLPLLDRLFDDAPGSLQDASRTSADALDALRQSVRQDIEALLNSRRRWRSPPPVLKELVLSPLGFGIPDCSGPRFADQRERERLRAEIETTLRRFEPRFASLNVSLAEVTDQFSTTLQLQIDGLLVAEPSPEPVAFKTIIEGSSGILVLPTDV